MPARAAPTTRRRALVDLAQSTAAPPPPPAEAAADSGGGGSPDASLAERRRKEEAVSRARRKSRGADEWQREEHEEAVAHLRQHERQRLEKERESRAEREQRKAAERADRDARKADERSFNLRPGITGPVSMRPGDWICPNPACEVVVYGTRSICFKCKTPKPGGAREKIVSKKEAAKIEAKEAMASVAARLGGGEPGGYAAARPKAVAKQEAAAKQEAEAAAKFAEQQTSWYLADGSLDHVRLLTSPSQTPDYATLAAQVKAALQGNTRELPHGTVLALVRRAGPEGLTISDLKTKLDGAWPDQPTTKALKLIARARHFTALVGARVGERADARRGHRRRGGARARHARRRAATLPCRRARRRRRRRRRWRRGWRRPRARAPGGGGELGGRERLRPEAAPLSYDAASAATRAPGPPPPATTAACAPRARHRRRRRGDARRQPPARRGAVAARRDCDDDRDDALRRRGSRQSAVAVPRRLRRARPTRAGRGDRSRARRDGRSAERRRARVGYAGEPAAAASVVVGGTAAGGVPARAGGGTRGASCSDEAGIGGVGGGARGRAPPGGRPRRADERNEHDDQSEGGRVVPRPGREVGRAVVAAGLEEQPRCARHGAQAWAASSTASEAARRVLVGLVMMRHLWVGRGWGPLRAIPIGTGHTVGAGARHTGACVYVGDGSTF